MRIFESVRKVLLVSLMISFGAEADFKPVADFECGEYLVQGRLGVNNQHHYVLSMRHGSNSPIELLLVSDDVRELMRKRGSKPCIKVGVRTPIVSNHRPIAEVISFERKCDLPIEGFKKVKTISCRKGLLSSDP